MCFADYAKSDFDGSEQGHIVHIVATAINRLGEIEETNRQLERNKLLVTSFFMLNQDILPVAIDRLSFKQYRKVFFFCGFSVISKVP